MGQWAFSRCRLSLEAQSSWRGLSPAPAPSASWGAGIRKRPFRRRALPIASRTSRLAGGALWNIWRAALCPGWRRWRSDVPEKCTVAGKVVKASNGEPLRKATVMLGSGRARSWTVRTDAAGHFLLTDIDPGQYTLSAGCLGYVPQTYSQR